MRKILWISLLLNSLLLGTEGEEVFKEKCLACHKLYVPQSELESNFMEHNNSLLSLKAPTLNQIVFRLKSRIGDPKGDEEIHRMEVEAFVSDYLIKPDRQKSVCLPMVLQHFETMPSLEGNISEEELEAINTFLYDYDYKKYLKVKLEYLPYREALTLAKKEHKIIMLKLTAEHCRFCKKMDTEVMVEDEVISRLNQDFISVELDVDKDKLPLNLDKTMTPTFIFVTEDEKIITKIPGSWNKKDFLELLNYTFKKREEMK